MRLDHIAYRVKNRHQSAAFFREAFGYTVGTEFQIEFDDGSKADCLALEPPETRHPDTMRWTHYVLQHAPAAPTKAEYHAPPEIFVSDGSEGSIVGDWVAERGNIGGIHHIAYQVKSVQGVIDKWRGSGFLEFASEEPLRCDGLVQVFTKPLELTGVIYEFIERTSQGFCSENVKDLMNSTKDNKF